MCYFAGSVHVEVSRTNIFARMLERPGMQALAYGMNLTVGEEVAMVLPLPVAPGSGDHAVTFVDLSSTPDMFHELARLFVTPMAGRPAQVRLQGLVVHRVGSFVASYVPTRAAFARLDPRFRVSDVLFEAVPHYADYGFAVFQLAPGNMTIHPMAFTFPTRAPDRLFFPTVHVHDGTVHATANFDHSLYYQHPRAQHGTWLGDDEVSNGNVSNANSNAYMGIAQHDHPVARRQLQSQLPNQDTWIEAT